jgi:alpha-glucosidase (family GH31 glycosyl hydrolase)
LRLIDLSCRRIPSILITQVRNNVASAARVPPGDAAQVRHSGMGRQRCLLVRAAAALCLALFAAVPASARRVHPRPPLCPRWALLPWVWDDRGGDADFSAGDGNAHRTAAVLDLVDSYRRYGIPVGTVILDSPWSTNYNTFRFDPRRYQDAAGLIQSLHQRNVHVVAWLTAAMNPASAAFPDDADYQQAVQRRYLLLAPDGKNIHWWKGEGGLINFNDPRAVRWWHGLMDRALNLGVDGWKVDKVEASLPDEVDERDSREPMQMGAYRKAYFRDTYRYLLRRRPEGVVVQRPFYRDTVAYTPTAWVGDQPHSWKGLRSAVHLVMGGARYGNAVVGSDIGGYLGGRRPNKTLFLRWAQFGALCPLMETGGQSERRPWMIDEETIRIFRRYATLHASLAPYLYSRMVEAHNTGIPIIRAANMKTGEYRLGSDLFVSLVMGPGAAKDVHLPAGDWIDWWDETRVYHGPALLKNYPAPLDRVPLFVRRGALLPLDLSYGDCELASARGGSATPAGALTLAAYPGLDAEGSTSCEYAYETGPLACASAALKVTVTPAGATLSAPPLPQAVRVQLHRSGLAPVAAASATPARTPS